MVCVLLRGTASPLSCILNEYSVNFIACSRGICSIGRASLVFILRDVTRFTVWGLSQITPGPRTASKNEYFGHFRPAPFRFHGRRDNFKNPYGRRCVEDAAPNSPGFLFKPVARKQPVKDPAGCKRPGTARFLFADFSQ